MKKTTVAVLAILVFMATVFFAVAKPAGNTVASNLVIASALSQTNDQSTLPEFKVFSTFWDAPLGAITTSPTIIIISPQDNETYVTDNVIFRFNVGSEYWVIDSVYFEADWLDGVHRVDLKRPNYDWARKASITVNFTGVPDGIHSLTAYANIHNGSKGSCSVFFATDTCPPVISLLSLENKTYYSTDLPLSFAVDEPVSWIGYSLNGQDNVTVTGNITLNDLPTGAYNVTVYATDLVGNTGASETVIFTLSKPFPTVPVLAASAILSVVVAALLVYLTKLRKRRREAAQT
jgi:hypothetical protein